MNQMKQLPHFYIDKDLGGNQERMTNPLLYFGGCGALVACDLCIYLAIHHGYTALCPLDTKQISIQSYRRFVGEMKHYLHPRIQGIHKAELWASGFSAYLQDKHIKTISLSTVSGIQSTAQAQSALCTQIDAGIPIPFLMLNNKNKNLKDYVWHWFLLNGYRETETGLQVQTVTYGSAQWEDFSKLWDTGYQQKGGMILLHSEI